MLLVPASSTLLSNLGGMENKEIRRLNMLELAEENGGLQGLADKTGTDAKYLSQVKNRWQGRGMGDDVARRIEERLGKPRGWMDSTRSQEPASSYGLSPIRTWEHETDLPPGEYVQIPKFEVHLSAGKGDEQRNLGLQIQLEFLQADTIAFRSDWIRKMRLRPAKLASMRVVGDSMEHRLHDGDAVVVDTSQTEVIDGKVYALWYDGGERVKRLYRLPGGGLRIRSDNDAKYPPIELKEDSAATVHIIGRVVHVSGEGGL